MSEMEEMFFLHEPENANAMPRKVYIEATSCCNLNCSICFRHGWIGETPGHMELKVFEHLAQELNRMPSVGEVFFGGMGEPLFHPDILKMVRSLVQVPKKSLLTNGTLLTPEMASGLIDAGIDELWLSMDGFDRESYEKIQLGSHFDQIKEHIHRFNELRRGTKVRFGITFVLTPDNIDQLECINSFADEIHADEMNISHVIPSFPLKKEEALYNLSDIPIGKMKRFERKSFTPQEHVCPFIGNQETFIRSDGSVAPCMQLLHNCTTYLYEQKRKITSFSYGNIKESTLSDCWKSAEYTSFRQRVSTFYFPFCTICWGCTDREENLCDCFLGEAPTCGACLWAQGWIRCP